MSDQAHGKKLMEEAELEPFLEEYQVVTGTVLEILGWGERPDFICARGTEPPIGIELVKVMHDPESKMWRTILDKQDYMDAPDAAILLQEILYRKDGKRASQGWQYPDRTILVLQIMDARIDEVVCYFDSELMDEMTQTGFLEIWAADYTLMEPYGTVQLLGIKPQQWRGLHSHRFQGMKPYG